MAASSAKEDSNTCRTVIASEVMPIVAQIAVTMAQYQCIYYMQITTDANSMMLH